MNEINENDLRDSVKIFERFWLQPKKYAGKVITLRLRINKKWSGWRLKDELIESLGLEIGNTISTEVTPLFLGNVIDEDSIDLFASSNCADWLLDNEVKIGTIIDCNVRLAYPKSPVGLDGKEIYTVSLVLEKGHSIVGFDKEYVDKPQNVEINLKEALRNMMLTG